MFLFQVSAQASEAALKNAAKSVKYVIDGLGRENIESHLIREGVPLKDTNAVIERAKNNTINELVKKGGYPNITDTQNIFNKMIQLEINKVLAESAKTEKAAELGAKPSSGEVKPGTRVKPTWMTADGVVNVADWFIEKLRDEGKTNEANALQAWLKKQDPGELVVAWTGKNRGNFEDYLLKIAEGKTKK